MPQTHVRPFAGAFGRAPVYESLLSPEDAFTQFTDFIYGNAPTVASGAGDLGGGFGFVSAPAAGAPARVAMHGGVLQLTTVGGADDGSGIVTGQAFNPATGTCFIAARLRVQSAIANQLFIGLADGAPGAFYSGAGAVTPAKYLGVGAFSNAAHAFSTDGTLRIVAKTAGSTVILPAPVHTQVLGEWFVVGLVIEPSSIRCWVNGVDRGVLAYSTESLNMHASLSFAFNGSTAVTLQTDWMGVSARR